MIFNFDKLHDKLHFLRHQYWHPRLQSFFSRSRFWVDITFFQCVLRSSSRSTKLLAVLNRKYMVSLESFETFLKCPEMHKFTVFLPTKHYFTKPNTFCQKSQTLSTQLRLQVNACGEYLKWWEKWSIERSFTTTWRGLRTIWKSTKKKEQRFQNNQFVVNGQ